MELCRDTDRIHKIKIKSRLIEIRWLSDSAIPGARAKVQIYALFIAERSEVELEVRDAKDKTIYRRKHYFSRPSLVIEFDVSNTAQEFLYARAILCGNGESQNASPLPIMPSRPLVFDQRWQQTQIRRNQTLCFEAQSRGLDNGDQVYVDLFLRSHQANDIVLTGFKSIINENKIRQHWQFNFPITTKNLPFPFRVSQRHAYQAPLIYAVSHAHQLQFQQARENYLAFTVDEIGLQFSRRSLHHACATLYSSDGNSQEIGLRQNKNTIFNISPGRCLLIMRINKKELQMPTKPVSDNREDSLKLPYRLKLQQAMDFVPAPLPESRWQTATDFRPRCFHQELLTTINASDISADSRCRFRECDGLLAIAANTDGSEAASKWNYFQLAHNLLLPVKAIDASGAFHLAAALAYVDNQGKIHPFALTGHEEDYVFAMYQGSSDDDNSIELAIWSNSGKSIEIDISLARLARALRRLENRRYFFNQE